MQAAQEEVALREKEAEEAMRRLATAKAQLQEAQNFVVKDVKEQLKSQSYANQQSEGIRVTGMFEPFVVPGCNYCIGTCDIPRELFAAGSCLDLSFMVPTVFHLPGNNILEQVQCFFADKWEDVKKYDFFYLPVNTQMKAQGRKKIDLPNVCFAVTIFMLQNDVEFFVADPLHKGVDPTVRVINFSQVYRSLVASRCKVQTGFSQASGLSFLFYQRGMGKPD